MTKTAALFALSLLLLPACGEKDEVDDDTASSTVLRYYTSCGDPSCADYNPDWHTNPVCTTEAEGDLCEPEGAGCDLEVDCNVELVCAYADPKEQEGGCPISLASAKEEIRYLDGAQEQALHAELMGVKLATWRYKTEEPGTKGHVGFIIDDQRADSPMVLPSGERVDLYGYTSMAVAALKVQEARLAEVEAENAELRERLARLEARLE